MWCSCQNALIQMNHKNHQNQLKIILMYLCVKFSKKKFNSDEKWRKKPIREAQTLSEAIYAKMPKTGHVDPELDRRLGNIRKRAKCQ